ncbi:MAG: transmembrane domain-containing protein [Acholeplasmatales bacterium]|jgi:heme exporter protein D|nr:transmembrane domain-containing protein [Acholeplasmatales bacterium]
MARSNSKTIKVNKISKYKQTNSKVPFLVWLIIGVIAVVLILVIVFSVKSESTKLSEKYNKLETPANLIKKNHYDVVTYEQLERHIDSGNALILLVGGVWQSATVTNLQVYEASLKETLLFFDLENNKFTNSISEKVNSILFLETKDLDAYKEVLHKLKDQYSVPYEFSATSPSYNENPQLLVFYGGNYVDGVFKHNGATNVRDTYVSLYNIIPEGYKAKLIALPGWAIAVIVIGSVAIVAAAGLTTFLVIRKKKQLN